MGRPGPTILISHSLELTLVARGRASLTEPPVFPKGRDRVCIRAAECKLRKALPLASDQRIDSELAAPSILVAVPQLGDPNFSRGVVLVLEHNEQGSMGLLINRQSDLDFGTFCESQKIPFTGDRSARVFTGGPVQTDRAFILHASAHEGPETEVVLDQVRLSYSIESLKLIASQPPKQLRIYLGYSGWGPGQLAEEMAQGAWLLGPASRSLIFEIACDQVWDNALKMMGIEPFRLMHSGVMH